MSYGKMTFSLFKESLEQGKYETATAARRAIGKAADFSENQKDQARKLVETHFSEGASKKVDKKAEKKPAKAVEKKAAAEKPAKAAKELKAAVSSPAPATAVAQPTPTGLNFADPELQIRLAEEIADRQSAMLNALAAAKAADPRFDASARFEEISNDLSDTISLFRGIVRSIKENQAVGSFRSSVTDHATNGVGPHAKGEALFRDSMPVS